MFYRNCVRLICLFFICVTLFACKNYELCETIQFETNTPILIIDPGHGGADGGAVGLDGIQESQVNLDIALKLHAICKLYGVESLLTREQENIEYPENADTIAKMKVYDQRSRLGLIQDCQHGILFSIHQNYFPTSSAHGVQVFYGHSRGDRELGDLLQTNLIQTLYPSSRRVAAEIDDDIYLMRECNCPAALIECGFLSNREDVTRLQTERYRVKLSIVLLASFVEYINR